MRRDSLAPCCPRCGAYYAPGVIERNDLRCPDCGEPLPDEWTQRWLPHLWEWQTHSQRVHFAGLFRANRPSDYRTSVNKVRRYPRE